MSHELQIKSSFSSALGGEAYILEANPSMKTSELPVYFHGGHGVNPEKYLRYAAEAHNLRAFSIVYPNKRPRDTIYWAMDGKNTYHLDRREVRKVAAIFAGAIISQGQLNMAKDLQTAIEQQGGKVRAVGQSLGALSVTKAVADAPHAFASVVLPFPAGMIRPDMRRVARSGLRYARAWQGRGILTPEESMQAYMNEYASVMPGELPANVAANGDNILQSYHAPLLKDIRNQSGSVSPYIAIIAGRDDHIFSPERIKQHIGEDSIDRFIIVEGRHAIGDRRLVMDMVLDVAKTDV